MKINIHAAKTHLSRLVERVAEGETIVIAKAGKPVARLVPIKSRVAARRFGRDRGKFKVPDDFNAPLPEALLRDFEG
jgi:prevent-host-death family protein